jgi:hypothetical protein
LAKIKDDDALERAIIARHEAGFSHSCLLDIIDDGPAENGTIAVAFGVSQQQCANMLAKAMYQFKKALTVAIQQDERTAELVPDGRHLDVPLTTDQEAELALSNGERAVRCKSCGKDRPESWYSPRKNRSNNKASSKIYYSIRQQCRPCITAQKMQARRAREAKAGMTEWQMQKLRDSNRKSGS